MAIAPAHERSQCAGNGSQWIFLDYADGGAREGESWKKNSWWIFTTNGWTYPPAKRGPTGEVIPAVEVVPRCAAWQTWQVASF